MTELDRRTLIAGLAISAASLSGEAHAQTPAPGAQGQGLGRQMMSWIEAEGRRRGHQRLWLYTNEVMAENIAMYQRLGFGETHRAEESGYRRVFFEKSL